MTISRPAPRIATLDAVRGVAVLGILLLNIVDFGMPGYAYVDPTFYGGATGADWWAWAITFVVADGKMRGLFTILFGASTALIADRAIDPARTHYARMATLFVIGMVHAYLIWPGDILVSYAICGALLFLALRWNTATLLAVAALMMAGQVAGGAATYVSARHFAMRATAPDAPPAIRAKWVTYRDALDTMRADIPTGLTAHRGGWRDNLSIRASDSWQAQTRVMPATLPEALALMLIGVALFRSGFFAGGWPRRHYVRIVGAGYLIGVPLYLPIVWWIDTTSFDPVTLALAQPLQLVLLRPIVMLAHASLVILWVTSGRARWLSDRLAAAGRMALSNYLATSIVCTTLFSGYGLGWYGHLSRWQLYPIVFAIWIAILCWSKPWLANFAYGPVEWLWRSVARGKIQSLRHAYHRA